MKEEKCANYERDIFMMNADTVVDSKAGLFLKKQSCQDPIVQSVRQKLLDRSNIGINKYNTTLDSNNKDNYFNHLQEELMDGANYIEKLLQQKQDITQLIKEYPNDSELGKVIRAVYG